MRFYSQNEEDSLINLYKQSLEQEIRSTELEIGNYDGSVMNEVNKHFFFYLTNQLRVLDLYLIFGLLPTTKQN